MRRFKAAPWLVGALLCPLALLCATTSAHGDRFDYFLKQLEAPGFKVRLQAAYILGTLGDKRAVTALVRTLGDAHYAVRGAAAIALGSLGDPAAVEPLAKTATDDEAWVRAEVMKALGRLKATDALPAMFNALDDSDWKVRHQATRALGLIGDPRAILPLARVIETGIDGAEVLDEAKRSLLKLAPSVDGPQMQSRLRGSADKHERAQAAVILGVLADKTAVPALIDALADRAPYVRGYAAIALASLADSRALEPLRGLAKNESHDRIRSIAALALSLLERRLKK